MYIKVPHITETGDRLMAHGPSRLSKAYVLYLLSIRHEIAETIWPQVKRRSGFFETVVDCIDERQVWEKQECQDTM